MWYMMWYERVFEEKGERNLLFVELEGESIGSTVQVQFSWREESVGAWGGFKVVWLRDVVVLLTNLWDRGGNVVILLADNWSWLLRLRSGVIVVIDWSLRTDGSCLLATISTESWIVPTLIVASIIILIWGVIWIFSVLLLSTSWLILWLNRLWNWLWWSWRGDWQVISGSLESTQKRKISIMQKVRKTFTLWMACVVWAFIACAEIIFVGCPLQLSNGKFIRFIGTFSSLEKLFSLRLSARQISVIKINLPQLTHFCQRHRKLYGLFLLDLHNCTLRVCFLAHQSLPWSQCHLLVCKRHRIDQRRSNIFVH